MAIEPLKEEDRPVPAAAGGGGGKRKGGGGGKRFQHDEPTPSGMRRIIYDYPPPVSPRPKSYRGDSE